ALTVVCSRSTANAFTLIERPLVFGPVGLGHGQTFRFNAANLLADGTSNNFQLKIFICQGGTIQELTNSTFTLQPGQSFVYDFSADQNQLLFDQTGRVEILAILIALHGPPEIVGGIITGEIFDAVTGKTAFLVPAVIPRPSNQ
ncbi:MAG: hypothetical protein ABJA18_13075, partial [bacterium]